LNAVADLHAIVRSNDACNDLGMDTISAAATLSAWGEARGRFPSAEEIGPLLHDIALRRGGGDLLAEGSRRVAEALGKPGVSMSVKSLELPAYDPRGIQGQGISYATSNRGGCHVRGYMISPEILGLPEKLDRFAIDGKSNWTKIFQDFTAAIDSVGLCLFTSFAMGADDYADLYNAVCGTTLTGADFISSGERIWNIERMFNLSAGIGADQDTLPKRLLKEPMPEGPAKGWVHKLDQLLPEYYKLRGWGTNGIPTKEKLAALGVEA